MKKLLSLMLMLAMILTCITIPTSVSAAESLNFDYVEGDAIQESFDASNPSDVAGIVSESTDDSMLTKTYGGETYVYKEKEEANYRIPIAPAVPDNKPIYMKLRVHTLKTTQYGAGTGLGVYTRSSGGKFIGGIYINDGDLGVSGMVSSSDSAPAVDLIFKLTPNDGYSFYARKADSDGEWTTIKSNTAFGNNNALQAIRVGYNLAVSSVKIYTKQSAELEAVNTAKDAAAMETALATYAEDLGIDLTKLETIEDDNAVYARLLDTVFTTNAEVVAAFNAAVSAQEAAEFDADYVDGDAIQESFDASDATDVAGITSESTDDKMLTKTYGGETFVYKEKEEMNYRIPIAPAVPDNKPIYMKLRVHTLKTTQYGAGTGLGVYTRNSAGKFIGGIYINDGDLGVSGMVSSSDSAPAVDLIFKLTPNDGYSFYARKADSDGAWTTIKSNTAFGNNNALQAIRVGYNLAVSSVITYTKQAPEIAAVNKAKDAAAMETALTTYAGALGVDLTKLESIENDNAVYAAMIGTYSSAADIVAAFNAAVTAQLVAEFESDYVSGDNLIASFDAGNSAHFAGIVADDGDNILTKTYGGETYAYKTNGAGNFHIPVVPAVPDDRPIYVKLRVHTLKTTQYGAGTGLGIYTYNSGGKNIGEYINDGDMGTTGMVSSSESAPAVDLIFKLNPATEDGYVFYARKADSNGEWTTVKAQGAYRNSTELQVIRVGFNLAVSSVKIYTKRSATDTAIVMGEDSVTVKNYKTGTLILASYEGNGDKLLDCEIITSGIVSETPITISDKLNTNGATVIKAFLWNNLSALVPLCDSQSVNVSR